MLHKNGKRKNITIHRIVGLVFLENPNNYPQINHKDFNKQNNHVTNIEWCDGFYNQQHAAKKPNRIWAKSRLGKCGKLSHNSRPVKVFSLKNVLVAEYESQNLAAKATNSMSSKISLCCMGKRNKHNNLKFKYA